MIDRAPQAPPVLTIALCTLNRPEELVTALESLVLQQPCSIAWEVLVVDNGPHVATESTARSFAATLPGLRYITEPVRGLSRARHRAWTSALGQVIAYLDDDAIADPGWVHALAEAMRGNDDTVACFGGPVRNEVTGRALDLGESEHHLDRHVHVWGANMAFVVADLARIDAFSEPLGRKGKRMLGFEEILVQLQLDALGKGRVWVPGMGVDHREIGHSDSPWWGVRYRFWTGVSIARCERMAPLTSWSTPLPPLRVVAVESLTSMSVALRAGLRRRSGRLALAFDAATRVGSLFGRVIPLRVARTTLATEE